jgi:hypothetical protein
MAGLPDPRFRPAQHKERIVADIHQPTFPAGEQPWLSQLCRHGGLQRAAAWELGIFRQLLQ